MKKIMLTSLVCAFVSVVYAQKKLTPVTQSALTGIGLPNGSKQDGRLFYVAAAEVALELESEKVATKVQNTEVLILPPVSMYNFSKDSLVRRLAARNWKTMPTESANYLWVQKDNRFVIAYFSINTKQTDLYFAEAVSLPTFASRQGNTLNQTSLPVAQSQQNNAVNSKAIELPTEQQTITQEVKKAPLQSATPASKFAFTTINFDDGWVAIEQENWVQVTKSNVKVLIHYPNPTTNEYISDPDEAKRIAWNTLVAPRYSSLQNYFVARSGLSYIQGSFMSGTLTDKQTGQTFYVALFKRDRSPWIEFIAPSITAFGQATGFNVAVLNGEVSNSDWDPLQKFEGYNKFAVAASDLVGLWTNNFGGFTQYVNAYTGADAGMNTHSSAQTFEFLPNGTYNWSLSVASGFVGNIKFSGAKSSGKFTNPNNWQIHFSDLEGKPRLYNAYFSCVKGARILWLQDTGYGDYSSYGRKE
jgi:hypothetical protein